MYAPSPKASSSTPARTATTTTSTTTKPRRPKQPLIPSIPTGTSSSSSSTKYATREAPPHLQGTNPDSRTSMHSVPSAPTPSQRNTGQGGGGAGPSKVIMEKWMRDAGLEDVLEDLSSRFILNLPEEELASPERICFQVEQAHWFYEDFIRTTQPQLPSFNLKSFSSLFFLSCPLLSHWLVPGDDSAGSNEDDGFGPGGGYERLWERFMKYKNRVPVCGGILLDEGCQSCVLVKGWKSSASWGFPKGKINDEEEKWQCAAREVHEEIGYDITHLLNPDDFIEVTMNDQRMTLFIVCDVPRNARFETQTRKEISAIEWVKLTDLPTWKKQKQKVTGKKFYSVAPLVAPLKQWIKLHRGQSTRRDPGGPLQPDYMMDEESDGLTPIPTAAQPVSIDTQLRSDGTTSSAKIEIEMGDPAIATHISAGATTESLTSSEAKKNDRGETIDSLFSRFLGESSAGRGMSANISLPKTSGPATESQSADQAAHATSQGNAMQALLAKLASPAGSMNAPSMSTAFASPAPRTTSKSTYAPLSAPTAQMQTSPNQTHAQSLLSMLSPEATPAAPASTAPAAQQGLPPPPNFASHPSVPALPNTSADDKEVRRKALLDNMMAGLGPISSPASSHALPGPHNIQYVSHQPVQPPFPQALQPMFGQNSQQISHVPQMISGPPTYPYLQQRPPPSLPLQNIPPHSAGPHQMHPSGAQWHMPGPPSPMVPFNGIAQPPAFSGNMPIPPQYMPPTQPQRGHSQNLLNQLLAGPPPPAAPKPQGAGDLLNVLLGSRPTG